MMGEFAFVFPGQGSQSVGMLSSLAEEYLEIRTTFEEASEVLAVDLWRVSQRGPEEALNQTHITQPAILAASVGIWRVWRSQGFPIPSYMAGHSLGEYSALVCAQSVSFQDAVALVAQRGRLMQNAVPPGDGAMAAIIGLSEQNVSQVCEDAAQGQVVSPVNFNSPDQVVIAGHCDAVERAMKLAKQAKSKFVILLNVSVPSHCALMEPAAEQFEEYLHAVSFKTPQIPVYHNVDVLCHDANFEILHALKEQLYSPVRWTETIEKMAKNRVNIVMECGPGKVLTGLMRRIDKSIKGLPMQDLSQFDSAVRVLEDYQGMQVLTEVQGS